MKRTIACSVLAVASILAAPLSQAQSQGMGGMEMKGDMKGMEMKGDMKGMEMKGDMKGMDMKPEKKGKSQTHNGSGTVTKVDSKKGTATIAHGPVESMKWPAMTMTFHVKDKKMFDKVKEGEKVEFSFVQSGKDYTITQVK